MECPRCQFDNREGAKFCGECGHKFEIVCPACGTNNRIENKFCDECGSKLSLPFRKVPRDLSLDEKIAKIQKYLPQGLAKKILSQRDRIEGERKQVTVMFCDMEGFSPLAESLGMEDAYSIMDQVYEILIHKVHEYGGTVNEMTGDGIMALFGAPVALEDAPQRAVRSSLAIHREMTKFSDQLKREKTDAPSVRMRIGIHTGPVVVGTLGNDLRVEFKAVGDTVNLASRMEGQAEPGTTYITDDTFILTEGIFRFEGLGQRLIKGKREPINVYRVIASSSQRTRFDVNAERGLTPFTGRKRELELLLDGFERTKLGQGQAVSIVSEAGLGKSRLLYEFRKKVANEDVTFLEGKCLSYSSNTAYHPIIDILKANFDILENDEDYGIKEKVKRSLQDLDVEEAAALPYILELLSVKDGGIDNATLSPEGIKECILEALKQIVIKGSQIRTLILAFEDLHWIDQSSEDALRYLLDNIPGSKVFMIFTYRIEFVHSWGARSYQNQVNLNRLSNRESLSMAGHILGSEFLGKSLENFILAKTEGVPLFIEEFVKSLRNLKVIEIKGNEHILSKDIHELAVPSTIQDVIMAKIDTLPIGAKELLQIGSVIEREFSHALIKRVARLPEDQLLTYLSALKDSELLYERGIYPLSIYTFKHALTREVVFDSILKKRKKELHEKIASAIVEVFRDKLDEYLGLIAEHFILGENYEKAVEFSKLTAKKAVRQSAYSDAIAFSKKQISCLEKMADVEDNQKRIIDARISLASYCMGLNYHTEAMKAVAPIKNLVEQINYQKGLPRVYIATGTYAAYVEENIHEGIKDLEKAATISEQTGDFLSLWFANYFLGSIKFLYCDFENSLQHLSKAKELSRMANNTTGSCSAESTISINYWYSGNTDAAYNAARQSLELAKESSDIYILSLAHAAYGMSSFAKGYLAEAEKSLMEAVAVIERIKHAIWGPAASRCLGDVFFQKNEFEKALFWYEKSLSIFEESTQFPSWINSSKIYVASTQVVLDGINFHLKSIYEFAAKIKMTSEKGFASYHVGKILINLGNQYFSEAEDRINAAIVAAKKSSTLWILARHYTLYAELFNCKGDQAKAKENLHKAIDIFKECGADGWVEKYSKELAEH